MEITFKCETCAEEWAKKDQPYFGNHLSWALAHLREFPEHEITVVIEPEEDQE